MKPKTPITRTRGVCGGDPVVAGTRFTTATAWSYFTGGHSLAKIKQQFPDLSREQVIAAIAFEQGRRDIAPGGWGAVPKDDQENILFCMGCDLADWKVTRPREPGRVRAWKAAIAALVGLAKKGAV